MANYTSLMPRYLIFMGLLEQMDGPEISVRIKLDESIDYDAFKDAQVAFLAYYFERNTNGQPLH